VQLTPQNVKSRCVFVKIGAEFPNESRTKGDNKVVCVNWFIISNKTSTMAIQPY
jgi:hypothetical protein